MRTLRACLLDEPLPRLIAMADLWDAPVEGTSVRDVAESLTAHILGEGRLIAAREALPEDARSALDALIAARGRMPVAAFERRFGAIRRMGPGKLERERPWLLPINAAERLWYSGFTFRAFDHASGSPIEVVFVPSDMLAVLGPQQPAASDALQQAGGVLQSGGPETRNALLLDDVTTLLCHIHNWDVRLKANGEWDAASRHALAPMMRDADGVVDHHPHGRFAFLTHLIARLGWVRPERNRLRLVPPPIAHWLQSQPKAQCDALFEAWLDDPEWNDLAHVEGLALEMTHAWSNDSVHARKTIVDLWRRWRSEIGDSDSPIASLQFLISDFVAYVRRLDPDFARPDGRYDTWHVRDIRTGKFLHGFENWEHVEGALIRYIVEKPLRWLTGVDEEFAQPPAPPFCVADDGRVIIARHLRYERFQLARIADWVETRANAYAYQLSPRSLGRARAQGIRTSRVIEFLEESSGSVLPVHLKRALLRWEERGAEVRSEPVVMLRTSDSATMDALLRSPRMRRLVVGRLAPNCIAVRQRDADDARAAIVESGLLVDIA